MATFTPKRYDYRTALSWTGARKGIQTSDEKTEIHVGCPPEFGGVEGHWTPEHLLVAAVEACLMTTFLSLAERRSIDLSSYTSESTGTAMLVSGEFRFSEIVVALNVEVPASQMEDARRIIERVAEICPVSKSLTAKVSIHPTVRGI